MIARLSAGWPRALVAALAGIAFASWALVAVAHLDDAWGNDKVSGGWLVLGKAADEGTLYPPLFDGTHYGGTRWMPLPILAFAFAHRLGSNGYWSPKLLVYIIAIALFALLYLVLREVHAPRDIATGLVALALTVPVGFNAATTIAGDALATLLQLAAVTLVYRRREELTARTLWLAALLCALALLSKLSAVWAPLAIAIVLVALSLRSALVFSAAVAAFLAVGLVLTELASGGRFSENLFSLATAGGSGLHGLIVDAPTRLISRMQSLAGAIWLVAPLAVLAVLRRVAVRRITVFDVGFALAIGTTVITFADSGAYVNHLLDLVVLVPILAGSLCALAVAEGAAFASLMRVAIVVALVGNLAIEIRPIAWEALNDLRAGSDARYGAELLRGVVTPEQTLLAQDPGVPYALGRRPVVIDAFMLPRIADDHPRWVDALRGRIERQEFDIVVLVNPVTYPPFYADGDFGVSGRLSGTAEA